MKTPISYYGGKQSMLKYILPLIPKHKIYAEPFCGGAAVFWAKEPAKIECLNDKNGFVTNFYIQLKTNFEELEKLIDATLYSRNLYRRAMVMYDVPQLFTPLQCAWAFWILTNEGFNNQIGCWQGSHPSAKPAKKTVNKKIDFTRKLTARLDLVQLENKDACELIAGMDSAETFFYIDPPYVGAKQGHYGGYMQDDFNALLSTLADIKGKFLLSSYPNAELTKIAEKQGWWSKEIDLCNSASSTKKKRKTEVLTGNYEIETALKLD